MTPDHSPQTPPPDAETRRHLGLVGTAAELRRARAAARRHHSAARRHLPGDASDDRRSEPPKPWSQGPDGLRCWLPLRLPAHRASSATLAGAYPFLAGPPAPASGVYV